jgi:hypothetical protein
MTSTFVWDCKILENTLLEIHALGRIKNKVFYCFAKFVGLTHYYWGALIANGIMFTALANINLLHPVFLDAFRFFPFGDKYVRCAVQVCIASQGIFNR